MTGSFDGMLQGAFYGMLSAGMAYGIGEIFGHGRSFFQSRGDLGAASFKSLAHGVSRALIAKAQNQRAKAAFWSGFLTSGFSVGTKGYGGVTGRTLIMATVGGTVSSIAGGKFANGAVSGVFVHLFNAEGRTFLDGVKSIGTGLYRFGDYLARVSGYRDWREGSVMGDFYQEEALSQTERTYRISKYILTNPEARKVAFDAVVKYISQNPEYVAGRAIVIPVGIYYKVPVPMIATAGDIAYSADQIDSFVRGIVYGD